MASFPFARRYLGNRFYFLFLRLLRCFSSAGSPRNAMDLRYGTWASPMWVSPFGNLRINSYLRLPAAYRSLSRPSSAPDAKAFSLCSCSLDHYVSFGSRLASLYLPVSITLLIKTSLYFRLFASFRYYLVFNVRLCALVGLGGLEPPTSRLSGVRSNRLSYKPMWWR